MARCLWVWLLAAAISASRAASAAPAQHPDVVRGYQAWTRGEWSTASSLLIRYWQNEQYSKTYDVAFWLGTSWCRLAGYQTAGADLLDWSYHYHSMPEKERQ